MPQSAASTGASFPRASSDPGARCGRARPVDPRAQSRAARPAAAPRAITAPALARPRAGSRTAVPVRPVRIRGPLDAAARLPSRGLDESARTAPRRPGDPDARHHPHRLGTRLRLFAAGIRGRPQGLVAPRPAAAARGPRHGSGRRTPARAPGERTAPAGGPHVTSPLAAEGLPRAAWSGAGVLLDLVRVPPSGTWERRCADLYGLAEDWLGPSSATGAQGLEHPRPPVPRRLRTRLPPGRGQLGRLPVTTLRPVLQRLSLRRWASLALALRFGFSGCLPREPLADRPRKGPRGGPPTPPIESAAGRLLTE
jgi:hypothetical protein